MEINVNGSNKPQNNNNNVPSYLSGESTDKQSGSIFENSNQKQTKGFSVIDELQNNQYKSNAAKNKQNVQDNSKKSTPAKKSQSFGMPSLVDELENQSKKFDKASANKPAYQMTNEERKKAQALNEDNQKRTSNNAPQDKSYDKYRKSRDAFGDQIDNFNNKFDMDKHFDNSINKGSKFRKTTVFGNKAGYEGNVGGKTFKMYKRKNEIEMGSQYLGKIGNQDVNVEERTNLAEFGSKKYSGKIGGNGISITSKKSANSFDKIVYTGNYKGKNFSVTVNKNWNSVAKDAKTMSGSYGNQQVEIKSKKNMAGNSNGIQGDKIPNNFEDVVALLFVINSENK